MGKDGSDAATPSSGFKKSFASIFKSPAAEAYTRVLANSAHDRLVMSLVYIKTGSSLICSASPIKQ
jgi:hypothetical protein